MSAQSLQTEGKLLKETMKKICPPDTAAMEQCQQRWDSIAKPLTALERLEEVLIQTAGMTGAMRCILGRKRLLSCVPTMGSWRKEFLRPGRKSLRL